VCESVAARGGGPSSILAEARFVRAAVDTQLWNEMESAVENKGRGEGRVVGKKTPMVAENPIKRGTPYVRPSKSEGRIMLPGNVVKEERTLSTTHKEKSVTERGGVLPPRLWGERIFKRDTAVKKQSG